MTISRLFTLMMIIGLIWPNWLMTRPVQAKPAETQPRLWVEESRNSEELKGSQNSSPFLPVSMASAFQGDPITDTQTFTFTEDFTTHTYQDPAQTTADWNTFDGVLQLPQLADATSQENLSTAAVAVDNEGNSYVVWADYRNGYGNIYAQKFDPKGYRLWETDLRVTNDSHIDQNNPSVVLDTSDNLVIVWTDFRNFFNNYHGNIYAQKVDPEGHKLWNEDKQVDDGVFNDYPDNPAAALDPSTGDIVVVWQGTNFTNIYAQRLKTDGNPRWLDDIRVNAGGDTAEQEFPSVGVDAASNVYITWQDDRTGNSDIWIQKLNPTGVRLWADLRVNSDGGSTAQSYPAIATDTPGHSYVVWDGSNGVYAQKFDANGNKLWPEDMQVNNDSVATFDVHNPAIVLGDDGNAFVTWPSGDSGFGGKICLQELSPEGARLWPANVQVNSDLGSVYNPVVAVTTGGDIRVAYDRHLGVSLPYRVGIPIDKATELK